MLIVLLKISKLENKLVRSEELTIQMRESMETMILIGWLLANDADFGLSVFTWGELGTWHDVNVLIWR